jgi:hypothetical protein
LKFFVNGVQQTRISGEVDWQFLTYDLPAGAQTLKWTYSKNSSLVAGQDRGWVDQVQFAAATNANTNGSCAFALSPSGRTHSSITATSTVIVTTLAGCAWTVSNTNTWVSIVSGTNGIGSGTIIYTVAANPTALARSGNLLVGDQLFAITQSGSSCAYALSPASGSHNSASLTGLVSVTTAVGCNWTVFNTNAWISILSGANGTGSSTVIYKVTANTSTAVRTGNIYIAGQLFIVTQSGATPPSVRLLGLTPGGRAMLSVQGRDGRTNVMECTEDLIHWIPINTNSTSDAFIDSTGTNAPRRFYRSYELP